MLPTLNKTAAPAWARQMAAGALSSGSISRLRDKLPIGITRQIGTTPLGQGLEGKVLPSFTGGVGPTVLKQHPNLFSDPRIPQGAGKETKQLLQSVQKQPFVRQVSPTPRSLSPGARSVTGDVISDKVRVMQAHPNIFPKVYHETPTGYVMERMAKASPAELSRNSPTGASLYQKLRQQMPDGHDGWLDMIRGSGGSPVPSYMPMRETFWNRLGGRLSEPTNQMAGIRDLRGANIMKNPQGHLKVTDPILVNKGNELEAKMIANMEADNTMLGRMAHKPSQAPTISAVPSVPFAKKVAFDLENALFPLTGKPVAQSIGTAAGLGAAAGLGFGAYRKIKNSLLGRQDDSSIFTPAVQLGLLGASISGGVHAYGHMMNPTGEQVPLNTDPFGEKWGPAYPGSGRPEDKLNETWHSNRQAASPWASRV